jgi:hypothetical protein
MNNLKLYPYGFDCKECGGSGKVPESFWNESRGYFEYKYVDCSACSSRRFLFHSFCRESSLKLPYDRDLFACYQDRHLDDRGEIVFRRFERVTEVE